MFIIVYHQTYIELENIPKDGSIVLAGNHTNYLDSILLISSTKRVIHYMAKKEYFDSKLAWLFKIVGCISVDRSKKDETAVNSALEILNNNGAVGLFPEGTRNKTKDIFLLPFKFGTVSMAKKTGATIIPFGLTGDYIFRSKNLTIRYGIPFKVENMSIEEANDKLYKKVERLMRENLKEKCLKSLKLYK